ncbi:MAG: glycine--tRNA ligase, partial [Treponema sp.]|nr:glycine--tRNA ligase [Treponema sp.]
AKEIQHLLKEDFVTDYDVSGTVGKRYRRQDEVGTPFCVTVDYETINEKNDDGTPNANYKTVTVRFRDSMKQERVALDNLVPFIQKAIKEYKPVLR